MYILWNDHHDNSSEYLSPYIGKLCFVVFWVFLWCEFLRSTLLHNILPHKISCVIHCIYWSNFFSFFTTGIILRLSLSFIALIYFLFFIYFYLCIYFLKDFTYLFMRDRERERGRDTGRGRSRLHAGSPIWDSIRVSRITSWAEGSTKPLRHPGCPNYINL